MILVGIDPGVNTGFALWNAQSRELLRVECHSITQAQAMLVSEHAKRPIALVIFEDARKIRLGGGATYGDRHRLQGVGSVKRDSAIWEEFLTMHGIPFVGRKAAGTKLADEPFRKLTGWKGRTNNHARDAAMIVFGMNVPIASGLIQHFNQQKAVGPVLE
jgi:hypothetical protein